MDKQNKVLVFKDTETLSSAAANYIADLATKSIEARERFVISISGGSTPEKLYSLLSSASFQGKISWPNVFVFWGDERCVPLNDSRNNYKMAKTLLLDKVNIPASNIYPVPVNLPPAEAAKVYTTTIKAFFADAEPCFDLVLLGLGENGHTASLFPASDVLKESSACAKEVFVQEQNIFRITMTAPLINQAHNIAFLVSGKSKAEILKTIFTTAYKPNTYPAQLIRPKQGELLWLVDKEAAELLK